MNPRAVLGIDAAWTPKNPSGVALAVEDDRGWRLVRSSPSYETFIGSDVAPSSLAADLLKAAIRHCGVPITLVAVDMPLSREKITMRRASDDAVSKRYGARWAATHSPSTARPGQVGETLQRGLVAAGYPLITEDPARPGLIEVYPHPALIELTGAPRRLEYKFQNRDKYWKSASDNQRRENIIEVWRRIGSALEDIIVGAQAAVDDFVPVPKDNWVWKAQEDRIDAIVCAAVAIEALEGRARPFGDGTSAIWIPSPRDQ